MAHPPAFLSRHDPAAARLFMTILTNKDLDTIHLMIVGQLNEIRGSIIEIDRLMRVMHQDRHPIPKPELDMSPTQPLDPETIAEIDETA